MSTLTALGTLAATTNKSSGGSPLSFLFPLLLVGAFYFLLIRPQRNRAKQSQQMRQELAPGVEVLTTFGLYATVIAVEDSAVVLEVAPGVHSRYSPQVVSKVLTPAEPAPDAPAEPVVPEPTPAEPSAEA